MSAIFWANLVLENEVCSNRTLELPTTLRFLFQNELLGHFFVIFLIPTRPIWMIVQVISGQRKKSDGVITTWSQTKDHLELEKMPGTRAIIVRWTSSRNWRWHSKVTSMSGWEKCLGRIKRALCTDLLLAQQGLVVNFFAGLRHPEGLDCSWRKWLPASDDEVLVLHGLEPQPRSPQAP